MSNSADRKLNLTHALNEINDQLALKEIKITEQKTEIGKTQIIIAQCNDCLNSQNNALQVFIKDKEKLEADKAKYQTLLDECEVMMNGVQKGFPIETISSNNSMQRLPLFSDSYEIVKAVKSLKFYRAISEQLSKGGRCKQINYINQTVIPNQLKTSTLPRSMIIYRIDTIGEYPLESILNQPVTMATDIHVSCGAAELLSVRGSVHQPNYHTTPIEDSRSFFIHQDQTVDTKFVLLVSTVPMTLAIDIHRQFPEVNEELSQPEGYNFSFPMNSNKHYSFIKRNLTVPDLRSRILFFDAYFSLDIHNKLVPVSLTVLDYQGAVMINTIICPRTHIKEYLERQHGLTEKEIIGTPDAQEMLKYFYSIVWDKVLVGYGLQSKIRDLGIDEKYLCGVRDLESSCAMRKVLGKGEKSLPLNEAMGRILNQHISNSVQTTKDNVQNIRWAYLKVESEWNDSMSVFVPEVTHGINADNNKNSRWGQLHPSAASSENGYAKRAKI